MFREKKILVLAPHTDDGEFGCGATINRLIEEGNEVYCAAFSACRQSVLPQFPPDILITEIKAASKILGILPDHLFLYDYEVRTFNYRRQEILQNMIDLREKIQPHIVLMPSMNDIHQDHHTIAQEGLRAFKYSAILCYEMPWNNITFSTTAFVPVQDKHIEKKIQAIKEYKSQQHRSYSGDEFIRSWARMRGEQIKQKYAEAFEVLRWII